jgi:23S rRNA U2552 (ribose-2'-O)-methylase RlmE/FtsJ
MNDLLELGKQYKSTKNWAGFLEIYSDYFKDYKDKEINILEIGIDKGESLKIWRKYFTRAKICGIDIIDIKFQIEGVDLIKADQTDEKTLREICDKYKGFDIIIDDGGHHSKQIVISLNFLFDYLKDNGLYIVKTYKLHIFVDLAVVDLI